MPPRKPVRKPAQKNRRTTSKNKQQLPAGLLFLLLLLLFGGAFMILRMSGDNAAAEPQKKTEEKHRPEVAADVTETQKKPEQKTDEPDEIAPRKEEPEIQIVEKRVETISAVNAVKLFMFDKELRQDSIKTSGNTLTIDFTDKKTAEKTLDELADYLFLNGLEVVSKAPVKVRDIHGEYTITYNILPKPKPEPEPEKQKAIQKTEKQKDKPSKTEKEPKPEKSVTTPKKPVNYTARLAVVIDDCGFSIPLAEKLAKTGFPVTYAVIPFTPYGIETAKIARKSGNVLFIHFPMQPKSYPSFDPGKGALFLNMPEPLIQSVTRANFEYFNMPLDGANNHTGSAFTESAEKMEQALKAIGEFTPRFLDSYTSASSKAYDVCRKLGMQCAVNSTFLDNEEPGLVSTGAKQSHVKVQLVHAARKALSTGSSIAIGHLRNDTVAALPDALSEIDKMGVKIVPVTELMK